MSAGDGSRKTRLRAHIANAGADQSPEEPSVQPQDKAVANALVQLTQSVNMTRSEMINLTCRLADVDARLSNIEGFILEIRQKSVQASRGAGQAVSGATAYSPSMFGLN